MNTKLQIVIFLLLTTILSGIIGWLIRKLKDGKQIFTLNKKLNNLRETVSRQRLELSATEDKNAYMQSLVKDSTPAPIADQNFDSEYDKLKASEQDLKVKLSQLYAKKQSEIHTLSSRLKNLETRLSTINNESTIEVYPQEITDGEASKLKAKLEKIEAQNAQYLSKLRELQGSQVAPNRPSKGYRDKPSVKTNKRCTNTKTNSKHKQDLTVINGIGSKIQTLLYGQGIYTYQQIADFRSEDIRRLSNELGNFSDRIKRDEWIKQARKLTKGSDKNQLTSTKGKGSSSRKRRDDLTQIKGIGPKIQTVLNKHGIRHFEQIAEFKSKDIKDLAKDLGSFADRIQRDEWIKQARQLQRNPVK